MKHLAGIVVVMLVGSSAWAGKTQVFPLAMSGLQGELAESSDALTHALAESIDGRVAKVSIEDAAELLGCDVETTACLEKVAGSAGAHRLVFGMITRGTDATIKVTLTRFDLGPARQQRTFTLTGRTTEALASELVRVAAPLFDAGATTTSDPSPAVEQPRSGVTPATWLLVGGGLVAGAVGSGFLVSARGLRDDVATAPKFTDANFDHLVKLEDQGRTRTRVGEALVVAGGIAVVLGVVRAIVQRDTSPTEPRAVRITPVPIDGGAAVVLSVGMP